MRIFLFILFSLIITVIIPLFAGRLLSVTNKRIWKSTLIHYSSKYFIYSILFFVLLWIGGSYFDSRKILLIGVTGTSIAILVSFILIATLPVSIAYQKVLHWLNSMKKPVPVDPGRRQALKTGAALLPLLALGSTGTGVARSFQEVQYPELAFYFKDLPDPLENFTILHLSDLHLGYYLHLEDLERILDQVESRHFDMVLITGDVADDLTRLTDALNLIDQVRPTIPKYMSLGNHEYHRGIEAVYESVRKSRIPLLKNRGITMAREGARLFIGGADDPVTLNKDFRSFLDNSVAKSMKDADPESFRILMSHRPRALDVADKYDIDLVLSGHTHGGQIGMNGRSLFESIAKENYLWGPYKNGNAQLYTSAGVGHWFPFRLGCPPEAPLIILKKQR